MKAVASSIILGSGLISMAIAESHFPNPPMAYLGKKLNGGVDNFWDTNTDTRGCRSAVWKKSADAPGGKFAHHLASAIVKQPDDVHITHRGWDEFLDNAFLILIPQYLKRLINGFDPSHVAHSIANRWF